MVCPRSVTMSAGRRNVTRQKDRLHAGHRQRRADVDAASARVRQRAEQQPRVQHPVGFVVFRVLRLPGDLRHEIRRHIVLSNEFAGHSSCPPRHLVVTCFVDRERPLDIRSTRPRQKTRADPPAHTPCPHRRHFCSTATCSSASADRAVERQPETSPFPGTVSFVGFPLHAQRPGPALERLGLQTPDAGP